MRDYLYGLAKVLALSFLRKNARIYLSRRDIRIAVKILVDKSLVVPQIKIRLRSVIRHEDLTVLEG